MKASNPPVTIESAQSFVSPNTALDKNTSATIFTFPSTVVVVALVRAITLLWNQLYSTALQHPKITSSGSQLYWHSSHRAL